MAVKNLWGVAITKSFMGLCCYYYPGKINLGFQITHEAARIAEESGDIYSKVISVGCHGISCHAKGLLEEAEKHLIKGVEFSERINFPTWEATAHFYLGETYFETGDFKRSKEHYEKGSWVLEHNRL